MPSVGEFIADHTPGYIPEKSNRMSTVSVTPWAIMAAHMLHPVARKITPSSRPSIMFSTWPVMP